ncbi:hypothetical protein BDZ45DRAFT_810845 [Acephala macrosclerotiorum]|nr:hypothetical protein BDZ45DRAFT_810845 [Acephala macrosclerotiorum]
MQLNVDIASIKQPFPPDCLKKERGKQFHWLKRHRNGPTNGQINGLTADQVLLLNPQSLPAVYTTSIFCPSDIREKPLPHHHLKTRFKFTFYCEKHESVRSAVFESQFIVANYRMAKTQNPSLPTHNPFNTLDKVPTYPSLSDLTLLTSILIVESLANSPSTSTTDPQTLKTLELETSQLQTRWDTALSETFSEIRSRLRCPKCHWTPGDAGLARKHRDMQAMSLWNVLRKSMEGIKMEELSVEGVDEFVRRLRVFERVYGEENGLGVCG